MQCYSSLTIKVVTALRVDGTRRTLCTVIDSSQSADAVLQQSHYQGGDSSEG
ncbi:hypothetical protein J6590_084142 [Homalodisca vitripennis]|nr:hypothetical protein J6590_084142 [Homalodisca vitripennis]